MLGFRKKLIIVLISIVVFLMLAPTMIPTEPQNYKNRSVSLDSASQTDIIKNLPSNEPVNLSGNYNSDTYVFTNHSLINGYYCNHGNVRQPYDSIYDPTNHLIYVIKLFSSSICIVNASTKSIVKQIPVNTLASCMVYSKINNRIFISSICNDYVVVLNPSTDKAVKDIPVGINSYSLVLNPSDQRLYVFNEFSKNISVINTTDCRGISSIRTKYGTTEGYVSENNEYLFAITNESESLCVINISSQKIVKIINTGAIISGITCDANTGKLYISSAAGPDILCIDRNTLISGNETQTPLDGKLFFCSLNNRIYLSDSISSTFSYLNLSTMTMGNMYNASSFPVSFTLIPSYNIIFLDEFVSCSLSFMNFSTFSIIKTINTTYSPYSAIYCEINGYIYITQEFRNDILILNRSNFNIVSIIPVQLSPKFIRVNPFDRKIYVINSISDTISVISPLTNKILYDVRVGSDPTDIAFNPFNGTAYVSNYLSGNISIIKANSSVVNYQYLAGKGATSLSYDSKTGELFIANKQENEVCMIPTTETNTSTGSILINEPYYVLYCEANELVYISNRSHSLTIFDPSSSKLTEINTPNLLGGMLFNNPSKGEVYYMTYNGEILIFQSGSKAPAYYIKSTSNFECVAFSINSKEILFTDPSQGTISILHLKSEYPLKLTETGLYKGTIWFFNLTTSIHSGPISNQTYLLCVPEGSYSYTAQSSNKVFNSSIEGNVNISESGANQSVEFKKVFNTVIFETTGNLTLNSWSISTNNISKGSEGNIIEMQLPNGSYFASVEMKSSSGSIGFPLEFFVHGTQHYIYVKEPSVNNGIYYFPKVVIGSAFLFISLLLLLLIYLVVDRRSRNKL